MIDKLAVYVLTYHNHEKAHLERCFWSIENQPTQVKYDVVVNYNSTKPEHFDELKEFVPEDYTVIQTESDGYTGKGINSCFEHYLENYENNQWTHMCIVSGRDYYYPMAFELLEEIHRKSNFDYLSGMAHHVDSLRPLPPHRDDPRMVYPYQPKKWVWTFVDNRLPVFPFLFWDGETVKGEDFPLCVSTKAVQSGLKTLEGKHDAVNYILTLNAIVSHLNDEINFVSTDCNEIYIMDKLSEIRFGSENYDEEKGWPFDSDGLVYSEINSDNYKVLENITRQFLPYVTMPQIWNHRGECEFVSRNELV